MIFMKIISWKSEKENHNLKQRKISNQSLTMWNEHFRILNETCKKKETRILQSKMESIQREITSLSLYARVHISSAHLDAQFPSALFFFFILPNCSNSISTTVLHANRRKHNGDKLNLKKTNLTNNHSNAPCTSNGPELANGYDRSMDDTGSCLPNMITLFSVRWVKARVNRHWKFYNHLSVVTTNLSLSHCGCRIKKAAWTSISLTCSSWGTPRLSTARWDK